jgi:uncharacterized protein
MTLEQVEASCLEWLKDFEATDSAHDISHILRVVEAAKLLCIEEGANIDVVLPAAYLHDCVTLPKNHPDNHKSSTMAADKAIRLLENLEGYDNRLLSQVHHAIQTHSYSANLKAETLEAKVLQDADRLDGLGAIGVSRCMAVAGKLGNKIYQMHDPFCEQRNADSKVSAVDHFYEKLFKTATTMQTQAGRAEAKKRVEFMQEFLAQLGSEIGVKFTKE